MDLPTPFLTVFTIGHSTRRLDELVALLHHHGIARLVDVRSVPHSRHNPQFDQAALERDLPKAGISYAHESRLGGFRHPRPDSVNTGLTNPRFRAYADHMATDEFKAAMTALMDAAAESPTTVMCAEGDPFRCHRRLIADALTARETRVLHIIGRGSASPPARRGSRVGRVEPDLPSRAAAPDVPRLVRPASVTRVVAPLRRRSRRPPLQPVSPRR